jgi:predicted phage terminase large subunit-like protein
MPHQQSVLTSGKRFKLLACGRRWGKTALGLIACIEGHGSYRGQFRGALAGGRIWWIVPSYPIAAEVWRDLKRAVGAVATDKSEVERRVELPGGGSITVKSADNPDSLRGPGLDGAVIDEAAFCIEEVWTKAIPPTIADKHGWVMLLSTPNGLNWFHDLFQYANGDEEWDVFHRPTSDNPIITPSELEALRRRMPLAAFLQEHEAAFTNVAGAEFPGDYFDDELWCKSIPAHAACRTVALDPSKGKNAKRGDYSASVFVGVCDGKAYIDAVLERCPVGTTVENTLNLAFKYQAKLIAYEANNFQELIGGEFERQLAGHRFHGISVVPVVNTANKEGRIQSLDPFLRNKELRFVDNAHTRLLVNQLREFPMAAHDDGPDALEMALRTMIGNMNAGEFEHPGYIEN